MPEADQQVGGKSDALPAEVEAEIVVGKDQQKHGCQKEVEVGEESPTIRVIGHVADRIDVDERAHTGDQQDKTHRQLVKLQTEVHTQLTDGHPGEEVLVYGAFVAGASEHVGEQHQPVDERGERHEGAEQMTPRVGAPACEQQHDRSDERERRQDPDGCVHPCLIASAGRHRRPRPSGGFGKWS